MVIMIMIVITIINLICYIYPTHKIKRYQLIIKIVIMVMIITIFVSAAKELNVMICKDLNIL